MSRSLLVPLFWLCAALAAVAQVAVLRAALEGRTPGASETSRARRIELFWVALPAAALFAVLVATWVAVSRAPLPAGG